MRRPRGMAEWPLPPSKNLDCVPGRVAIGALDWTRPLPRPLTSLGSPVKSRTREIDHARPRMYRPSGDRADGEPLDDVGHAVACSAN